MPRLTRLLIRLRAERWPRFRPAILANGGNMDSSCGLSNHGGNQGKSSQIKASPLPPIPGSERGRTWLNSFLCASATLREMGCFALGWCPRFSPSGTLWQVINPGFWRGVRRLFTPQFDGGGVLDFHPLASSGNLKKPGFWAGYSRLFAASIEGCKVLEGWTGAENSAVMQAYAPICMIKSARGPRRA